MPRRNQNTIKPFDGKIFVAFLDLSGFKKMLLRNREKANMALGKFYNTIYSVGREFHHRHNQDLLEVDSIVVSDCAVIFPRIDGSDNDENILSRRILGLKSLLIFIKEINSRLIADDFKNIPLMTTCSISFGDFTYQNRIQLKQVEKNYFLGEAYINAFIDSEIDTPKLTPGQCRVVNDNLDFFSVPSDDTTFSLLEPKGNYYYYHWMLPNLTQLNEFEREYHRITEGIYQKLIELLQRYSN